MLLQGVEDEGGHLTAPVTRMAAEAEPVLVISAIFPDHRRLTATQPHSTLHPHVEPLHSCLAVPQHDAALTHDEDAGVVVPYSALILVTLLCLCTRCRDALFIQLLFREEVVCLSSSVSSHS